MVASNGVRELTRHGRSIVLDVGEAQIAFRRALKALAFLARLPADDLFDLLASSRSFDVMPLAEWVIRRTSTQAYDAVISGWCQAASAR